MTLVTAKNQHRCWKARALRVRGRYTNNVFFERLRLQFLCIDKIKCHFFAIFSLFGYESTHIHIGVQRKTTPELYFYFHGESQTNIPNTMFTHLSFIRWTVARWHSYKAFLQLAENCETSFVLCKGLLSHCHLLWSHLFCL